MKQRSIFTSTITLLIVFFITGCATGVGPASNPVSGDSEITPTNQINKSAEITPDGGLIDLGWFYIEFDENALVNPATVNITQAELERPRDGAIVGGVPLHISILPENFLSEDGHYTINFDLSKLPNSSPNADFSVANTNIDIVGEWQTAGGDVAGGAAWAHRYGDVVKTFPDKSEITVALVDFSGIPEITTEPYFTDDPRTIPEYYTRNGQAIPFDPKNLGPLGDRIPVILIHGLQFFNMSEPESVSDESATYGTESFSEVLKYLNKNYCDVYSRFKFFWFNYPTGVHIFGAGGTGQWLGELINQWATVNDPALMERPLVIMGHSEGGLIAREYMQNQSGNVFRIITAATPHLGSPVVNIAYDAKYNGWIQEWINDFLTPGILDLACYEPISYEEDKWGPLSTSGLGNDQLKSLNDGLDPNDERLIVYGATRQGPAKPWLYWNSQPVVHQWCLDKLESLVKPGGFQEGAGYYYSDCLAPWRSQYYWRQGEILQKHLDRASAKKVHMDVLKDPVVLLKLYADMLQIEQDYPDQDPIPGDGNLIWAKRAGGGFSGDGRGITALSDNSTVVTGGFIGTAAFGEGEPNETTLVSSRLDPDIFIARYNADGTLAWAKRAGGDDYEVGFGIAALSDNSTVVTGWFSGSATFGEGEPNETTLVTAGDNDIFIARYNADGTLAWAKRAGGVSFDSGFGITALSDNSTVVTGDFEYSATFGEGEPNETTLVSAGSDVFIARYNANGTLVWAKRAGGDDYEVGFGITALSDNSTVVTGDFKGTATFGEGEPNETTLVSADFFSDIFIARYNANGTLAWAKRAGGVSFDSGFGITALSDNSTVVTGDFIGTAAFGEGEPNETTLVSEGSSIYDIFIARYNADGTLAWAKRAGGVSGDVGYRIAALSDNSTVVTGGFGGSATFGEGEPNETTLVSAGSFDIFIARYNADGTLAWAKRAGGYVVDVGSGITALSDNSTVVTGYFVDTATFGACEPNETTLVSAGGADIFIARFAP